MKTDEGGTFRCPWRPANNRQSFIAVGCHRMDHLERTRTFRDARDRLCPLRASKNACRGGTGQAEERAAVQRLSSGTSRELLVSIGRHRSRSDGCESPCLGRLRAAASRTAAPPEIAKPLGYETVDVSLPGCATPLPPVRDDISCGALQIGESIDGKAVCHLLEALKNWVASGRVSHSVWTSSHEERIAPLRSFLRLEADVPNRSQRMFVQMSEQSRTLEFFASPR